VTYFFRARLEPSFPARPESFRPIPVRAAEPMTASEYLFAAAMTVLIVWLVAEVSGKDPFGL
jgi:hypothetical protein